MWAIVGYGYWGKIMERALKNVYPNQSFIVYDKDKTTGANVSKFDDLLKYKPNKVFITTPPHSHKDLTKQFLWLDADVFCEIPFVFSTEDIEELYEDAKSNGRQLFIDWTYLYNNAVDLIKEEAINFGPIKNITMNRLDNSPQWDYRNVLWDLCIHDISIILKLFGAPGIKNVRNNKDEITSISGYVGGASFKINASHMHHEKNRVCIFEFRQGLIVWDDSTQTISINNGTPFKLNFKWTPLENAIRHFVECEAHEENERITREITALMEFANEFV